MAPNHITLAHPFKVDGVLPLSPFRGVHLTTSAEGRLPDPCTPAFANSLAQ